MWPREDSFCPPARNVVSVEFGLPEYRGNPPATSNAGGPNRSGQSCGRQGAYYISLISEGNSVRHLVWPSKSISELIEDAGSIFGLDPSCISLVLFSVIPVMLKRDSTVSGPPTVVADSSVMVFALPNLPPQGAQQFGPRTPPPPGMVAHGHSGITIPSGSSLMSPKLLASFKLPKFDGVSKNWKTWDRAFQRFLGLHNLDWPRSKRRKQVRLLPSSRLC